MIYEIGDYLALEFKGLRSAVVALGSGSLCWCCLLSFICSFFSSVGCPQVISVRFVACHLGCRVEFTVGVVIGSDVNVCGCGSLMVSYRYCFRVLNFLLLFLVALLIPMLLLIHDVRA